MAGQKLNSYQKLKESLRYKTELVNDLQNAIADNNLEVLLAVKLAVDMKRQTLKMMWYG